MTTTNTDRRYGVIAGLAIKVPCQGVSLANVTLSGEQTINGHAFISGERILVAGQTDQTKNGVYLVSTGSWTREPDFDGTYDVVEGTIVLVLNDGGENSYSIYVLNSEDPITIGTTALTFAKITFSVISGAFSAITVSGNSSIGGNETVGGTLTVTGMATLNGGVSATTVASGGDVTTGYDYTPTVTVSAGATTTLNANLSNAFRVTMGANITSFSISNPHDGQCLKVNFKQDGTGGRTIVWPAGFHWPNATVPILSTAANAVDVLYLQYDNTDGWTASLVKGFV